MSGSLPSRRSARPGLLVLGHDVDAATTRVQAGSLASWADDRGIRLVPGTAGAPDLPTPGRDVDAVAVLGSPEGAWDDDVPWLADEIALLSDADRRGVPVLGICFGGQLLARVLGGTVRAGSGSEHGWSWIESADGTVPAGPWMEFHFDSFTTPPGAERLAVSDRCDQAFRAGPHLGVQFHPEITPASFETWASRWAGTELEARLPSMGLSTEGLRADTARHAEASRAAGWVLFDGFAARAGLPTRILAG